MHVMHGNGAERPGGKAVSGAGLMLVTAMIWAGFVLTIRFISTSPVPVTDVALLRFGLPLVLLAPWMPRLLRELRHIALRDGAMIAAGAGLPFFLMATEGGRLTSAASVAALVPGTAPLAVAALRLVSGDRQGGRNLPALALILAGILVMTVSARLSPAGVALLLGASLLWGLYTIGLQRSALSPVSATLVICLPSMLVLLMLIATGAVQVRIAALNWADLMPFVLIQGFGVGVLASLTYTGAVRRIGAAASTAIGALAPVIATLLSPLLLGETLTPRIVLAIALISAGVALSTGLLRMRICASGPVPHVMQKNEK